jgi:hypothetical protein
MNIEPNQQVSNETAPQVEAAALDQNFETPRAATPQARRRRVQQLSDEIGRLTMNLIGCIVIGWSCFNFVKNVQQLISANVFDRLGLLMAIGAMVLFCVVPFGFGIWLLLRKSGNAAIAKTRS